MLYNLKVKATLIWESMLGFQFLTIWLTFNMILVSIVRCWCILNQIQYTSTLYFTTCSLSIICFLFTIIYPKFFTLFVSFLNSKALQIYLFTLEYTIYKFLARNYFLAGILMVSYLFLLVMFFCGILFGKHHFSVYMELFPIFYVFRSVFALPVIYLFIYISILKEHPLFDKTINNLSTSGIFKEGTSSFMKAVNQFWQTPGGKVTAGGAAILGGVEVTARVHKANLQDSMNQHEQAARLSIEQSGSYKEGSITTPILKRIEENRNALAHIRFHAGDSPMNILFRDFWRTCNGQPTLREQSRSLQEERYPIESSIRETDYHKIGTYFPAKNLDTEKTSNIIIPSIVEKLCNLFF